MNQEMSKEEPDIEVTAEDELDETSLEDIEANTQQKIKTIQAKLKACQSEKQQYLDDLQRAKADFLNARKRLESDKIATKERLILEHVSELLPLYDSFSMAMSNKEAWETVNKDWRSGVESIFNQLLKIIKSLA